jgi:hypothetical protein
LHEKRNLVKKMPVQFLNESPFLMSLTGPADAQLSGLGLGDEKSAVTSWRTIRTLMMLGVTGGIFSPVSKA